MVITVNSKGRKQEKAIKLRKSFTVHANTEIHNTVRGVNELFSWLEQV